MLLKLVPVELKPSVTQTKEFCLNSFKMEAVIYMISWLTIWLTLLWRTLLSISPLCGFYMITASVMKELKIFSSKIRPLLLPEKQISHGWRLIVKMSLNKTDSGNRGSIISMFWNPHAVNCIGQVWYNKSSPNMSSYSYLAPTKRSDTLWHEI